MIKAQTTDNFGFAISGHSEDIVNMFAFSWHYGGWFAGPRELQLQITCAGRISAPVTCVIDDFGSIVIPQSSAF